MQGELQLQRIHEVRLVSKYGVQVRLTRASGRRKHTAQALKRPYVLALALLIHYTGVAVSEDLFGVRFYSNAGRISHTQPIVSYTVR